MTPDILTPHEQQFITDSAKQMARSLESNPFIQPMQATLYGAGIGALAAIVMGKDVFKYALYAGTGSAVLSSVLRFGFLTGWKCGFCAAICNDPHDRR